MRSIIAHTLIRILINTMYTSTASIIIMHSLMITLFYKYLERE